MVSKRAIVTRVLCRQAAICDGLKPNWPKENRIDPYCRTYRKGSIKPPRGAYLIFDAPEAD